MQSVMRNRKLLAQTRPPPLFDRPSASRFQLDAFLPGVFNGLSEPRAAAAIGARVFIGRELISRRDAGRKPPSAVASQTVSCDSDWIPSRLRNAVV